MTPVVDVLKAQKLYLKLVECAMNQTHIHFNRVHDLLHGIEHTDTSEEEVQETNNVIRAVADFCVWRQLPYLTILISTNDATGPGRGFWKTLPGDHTLDDANRGALYLVFREACYTYYSPFCGHSKELKQFVYERVDFGMRMNHPDADFIRDVVREKVEYFAQASTNLDQIALTEDNPLHLRYVQCEFFINMAKWLTQACHYNDHNMIVWDMEFLRSTLKTLRREFTLTLPIGPEHNLFKLTLARELAENEMYMATIDEVVLLTACCITVGDPAMIEHIEVQNGILHSPPEGRRQMGAAATVGGIPLNAVANGEKCTFAAHSDLREFSHVTIRVSFRLG
jgi:hypothetical protein